MRSHSQVRPSSSQSIAFELNRCPAFSALRAYALSNRNMLLAVVIVLSTLPPTVIRIVSLFDCPSSSLVVNSFGERFKASTPTSRTYPARSIAVCRTRYLQRSLSGMFPNRLTRCDVKTPNEHPSCVAVVRRISILALWINSCPPPLVTLVTRASQLAAELLVVLITWWYTYQSYRLRRSGIKVEKSISSLLVYNGIRSLYHLVHN